MTRRKFLLVGIDGLRVADALRPGAAPALAALIEAGSLHPMTMEVPTWSGPGWSSILTGTTHAQHGVFDNTFHGNTLSANADLLSRAFFADPTRGTFAAVSWPPLADPAGPGPVIATRSDQQRSGMHRLVIRDGETYGYRAGDGEIAAFSRLALRDAGPDASFVYLGEVDEAGHLYGGTSPEYAAALRRVDAHLAGIVAAVAARAETHDEDWLIGVTSDHGHVDAGGHGGADEVVTASFLALGRFVRGGSVHPTALVSRQRIRPDEVAGVLLAHLE
ncbi:alkaline phosphatase family protein [Frondihabitans cladoniiphilus]|uniref:Type I phosphodiesterase/nucleotide pyrophosphatase n=1 Tax=Frondihabitans cladoniiphilus TaxID=715785 RepID=A0ABP8VIZ3_9MICO